MTQATNEREPTITRIVLIDHTKPTPQGGRVIDMRGVSVELSYQDDGRTLKVFVSKAAPLDIEQGNE
jgi:hypothetical protein